MYVSSHEDTATREVDDRAVGTTLFTPIRPEFRGPVRSAYVAILAGRLAYFVIQWQVACYLASTSVENRKRFFEVLVRAGSHRTRIHLRKQKSLWAGGILSMRV
jgi:hypothetical protein